MDSIDQRRYRVAVYRAKGDFFARVIEIPGCISRGATEAEAVENVRAAIRAYAAVAHLLSAGREIVKLEIWA